MTRHSFVQCRHYRTIEGCYMNTWPVELISYVFELACTGDGQTVRALSLTSKQFLEIARPYLYQSLVLSTRGHLITLLNRLKNIPSHLRRIRHLFLAPRHDLHSHHHCDSDALLVTKLLRIAAEHLFRISFPQLEELSIAGLYAFSFQSGNFPHLRRLHFAAGNRNPSGLFQFGALDKAFPELTHLRVSGISRALSFVDELGNALENAGKSAVSEHRQDEGPSLNDAPLKLPAQLESIYVQYASSSPSPAVSRRPSRSSSRDLTQTISMSGITNDRQGAMIVRLTDLEEKYGARRSITNRTRVQLVVLDPPLDNVIKEAGNRIVRGYAEDTVVRLKEDWLERLNGEDGPWISEAR